QALREAGVHVITLPALEGHPDCVFVEDPALVLDETAVITSMGCESRRGERDSLAAAIAPFRPIIRMRDPVKLEGGDVMQIGRRLFVGLSKRTDLAGVNQLAEELAPFGYEVTAVSMRNCLHLKSGCSYLGDDTVLINAEWIDRVRIGDYRFVNVAPDEPGAANALRVGDGILMPSEFPRTAEVLRGHGFKVRELDMSELLKAESGVTCSSLLFEA
ncbi:MAG TPA: arginine deiminase family protein, partial [Bryobacteraceae bacterium]|nr:arginine deiminase family protein [Bryobacteraceae bacterium]